MARILNGGGQHGVSQLRSNDDDKFNALAAFAEGLAAPPQAGGMPRRPRSTRTRSAKRTTALLTTVALASLTIHCSIAEPDAAPIVGGNSSSAGSAPASSGGDGIWATGGASVGGNSLTNVGGSVAGAAASGGGSSGGAVAGAGAPSGGVGNGSGVSGGGATVTCPSDVLFCDDFESYADMSPPSGKWKAWTVGKATLVVDSAQGFSGSKAAHFHGQVSQAGATKEQAFMLAEGSPAFPVAGTTFFLRFMLYGTRFPYTGFTGANHTALAWVGSSKALNSPDRGATNEGYILADYNGVAVQPMWSGYFRDTSKHFKDAEQANKWHCWEVEIDNAGGPPPGQGGAALPHIWEDGVELKLSPAGSGATYAAIPFEALLFSLWSPQTDTSAADYWVDDVAAAKSRINCPASAAK
jgi:hypothetical protein